MKISFLLQDLYGGGAEKMMINLANELANQGINVELLIVKFEGHYKKLISSKVTLVRLNKKRVLTAIFSLAKYLYNKRPDYLISTLTHVNILAILANLLALKRTRVIIRIANNITQNRAGQKLTIRLAYKLIPVIYPFSYKVLAVSKGVADNLLKYVNLKERIQILNNPVVTNEIENLANLKNDHRWFESNDVKVIIGIGRLVPQKDFGTLIRAFTQVQREKANARLIILGEGPERDNLNKLCVIKDVADKVDLLGFVDNPYSFLKNSDVFVLSSRWEGSPNVLVESMACGVPVIATDCESGPAEILDGGRLGYLVPVGDDARLAEAIIDVLSNEYSTEGLVKRAEDFRVDNVAQNFIKEFIQQ